MLFIVNPRLLFSQCETPDPSDELFEYYVSLLPSQNNYRLARASGDPASIPVSFTVVRNTEGSSTDVSVSQIDLTIDTLNKRFAPVGISFYRLGNVNYIDWTPLYLNSIIDGARYSYLSTAINVMVHPLQASVATQPIMTDNPDYYTLEDNIIWVEPSALWGNFASFSAAFIHEVGHIFGLLHTHGATTVYHSPPDSAQVDYPYPNEKNDKSKYRRELQIRDTTYGKAFPYPNWMVAGDLCDDTYPSVMNNDLYFPGWSLDCPYNGTYVDYNNDPITPQVKNVMSYFILNGCGTRDEFTDCQYDKVAMIYDIYRKYQLSHAYEINYVNTVNFENTAQPVPNAVFEWKFADEPKKWRSTSDINGNMQGILYNPNVRITSYKLGSIVEQPQFNYDPWKLIPSYAEWIEKLSSYDLYTLNNHIQKVKLLKNGYKKIAADLDKNHLIEPNDTKLLSNLLVGKIKKLDAYHSPYVFIPEFIPQSYKYGFDTNPFDMQINGKQEVDASYIDPGFEYEISNGYAGDAGFDGVKIGKVSGEGTVGNGEPGSLNPGLINPVVQLNSGQLYKLDVKLQNTTNLAAYQLKFQIDTSIASIINYSHPTGTSLGDSLNTYFEGNQLVTVWYNSTTDSTNVSVTQNLLSLIILPNQNASTSQILNIINARNASALYDAGGQLVENNLVMQATIFNPFQKETIIKNTESQSFIYPNPTSGTVNMKFELQEAQQVEYYVFDTGGKLQIEQRLKLEAGHHDLSIDQVSNLGAGLYVVVLRTSGSDYSQTFIKQ